MTSTSASHDLHNTACTRDHQSREKITLERRERKLKPPVKRIPATKKYLYTFGEIGLNNVVDTKRNAHNDELSRFPIKKLNVKKKEQRPTSMKSQASIHASSLDTQLTEIEKQLKSIQNQKKEITKIISRDLKERKSRWPEVKDKGSFFNMREMVNRVEDEQSRRIRESLASSIQEVRNFGDSLSNGILGPPNRLPDNRGDNENNPGLLLKDALEENPPVPHSILSRTIKPRPISQEKVNDSGVELSRGFSRLGIMEDRDYSVLPKNNEAALRSIYEEQEAMMIPNQQSLRNIHRPDQNASIQAGSSLVKKYPVLQNMLPEVFKSEFMKKSCCFD